MMRMGLNWEEVQAMHHSLSQNGRFCFHLPSLINSSENKGSFLPKIT
jgi:hypothetical protein